MHWKYRERNFTHQEMRLACACLFFFIPLHHWPCRIRNRVSSICYISICIHSRIRDSSVNHSPISHYDYIVTEVLITHDINMLIAHNCLHRESDTANIYPFTHDIASQEPLFWMTSWYSTISPPLLQIGPWYLVLPLCSVGRCPETSSRSWINYPVKCGWRNSGGSPNVSLWVYLLAIFLKWIALYLQSFSYSIPIVQTHGFNLMEV
jgi:hypothetical protein